MFSFHWPVETIGFQWKVNSDWALAKQLHKLFSWLQFEYENGRCTDTRFLAFTGTPRTEQQMTQRKLSSTGCWTNISVSKPMLSIIGIGMRWVQIDVAWDDCRRVFAPWRQTRGRASVMHSCWGAARRHQRYAWWEVKFTVAVNRHSSSPAAHPSRSGIARLGRK
jgi:hypothetical protein